MAQLSAPFLTSGYREIAAGYCAPEILRRVAFIAPHIVAYLNFGTDFWSANRSELMTRS